MSLEPSLLSAPTVATHFICHKLPQFDANDARQVTAAFDSCAEIAFHQSWLETRQSGFQTGSVRIGWSPQDEESEEPQLWVWAQLDSLRPPSNRTRRFGEPTWELGDVFEIFLQPPGEPYWEIHVTPEKYHLTLFFPGAEIAGQIKSKSDFENCLRPGLPVSRWSWFEEKNEGGIWNVLVALPLKQFGPQFSPDQLWRASFCRYDISSAAPGERFLSSTSPLTVPRFHRVHEWNTMAFEE